MSVKMAVAKRKSSHSSRTPATVELSVIVPAFREGRLIYGNLRRLLGELDKLNVTYEVIVVSDGNTDATVREVRRLGSSAVKVFHYPMNIGKGFALSFGGSQSSGSLVTFVNADMEFDPANISRFMSLMKTNECDAVIVSKRHPQSVVSYPLLRRVQSAMFQVLVRLLFNLDVRDTQSRLTLI